jgi:hypothetical protein
VLTLQEGKRKYCNPKISSTRIALANTISPPYQVKQSKIGGLRAKIKNINFCSLGQDFGLDKEIGLWLRMKL